MRLDQRNAQLLCFLAEAAQQLRETLVFASEKSFERLEVLGVDAEHLGQILRGGCLGRGDVLGRVFEVMVELGCLQLGQPTCELCLVFFKLEHELAGDSFQKYKESEQSFGHSEGQVLIL